MMQTLSVLPLPINKDRLLSKNSKQEQQTLDDCMSRINNAPLVKVLPKGSYIYLLYNETDLVYIGQTNLGVEARLGAHLQDKVFDSYKSIFIPNSSTTTMNLLEAFLIFHLKPTYNKFLPPNPFYTRRKIKNGKYQFTRRTEALA